MNDISALVIEDNDMLSALYEQALREAGFQTESAANGQIALDRLQQIVPDLLLIDLHLPYVSGEQVLTYVINDPRFEQSRIIVASADGAWAGFLSQQVDFVLNKPVSYKQLRTLASRLYTTFTTKS